MKTPGYPHSNGFVTHLPTQLINELVREGADVFTVEMLNSITSLAQLDELSDPVCALFFEPPSLDERIINQYALFSVVSSPVLALDDWYSRLKNRAEREGGAFNDTLKPQLEMSTLEITSINDDRIRMNVKMLIDNPLPVGFKASQLNYTILMANTPIIEDSYEKPIDVKSDDSTLVTLPMEVINKNF